MSYLERIRTTAKTPTHGTDKADKSPSVSSVSNPDGYILEKWNPEMAAAGYHWCFDCRYWSGETCDHPENPFHSQNPIMPRSCRWFADINNETSTQEAG